MNIIIILKTVTTIMEKTCTELFVICRKISMAVMSVQKLSEIHSMFLFSNMDTKLILMSTTHSIPYFNNTID